MIWIGLGRSALFEVGMSWIGLGRSVLSEVGTIAFAGVTFVKG